MTEIQQILGFWYSPRIGKHWFSSTLALDAEIRTRFEPLWQRAARGELDSWAESADGTLALIILLDQFPLNMYRGEPASFSTEQKAVVVSRIGVDNGFHIQMTDERRLFFFLPLMHSENLEDQDLSVSLFQTAGMDTRWPEHHRHIVRRFGRFPHRNAILDRASTTEELAYLASDAAFKG